MSSQDAIWNGPTGRAPFAIFEVVWGKGIVRKTFASSSSGYFAKKEEQEYEVMTRARMPERLTQSLASALHTCCTSVSYTKSL